MIKQSSVAEKIKIAGISTFQFLWELSCDYCNAKLATKGREAGDLHELGLKFGWKVITNQWFGPCRWQCTKCLGANGKKNGKLS